MALTLNQFIGFETGGLHEADGTTNTPDATEATIVRTGSRSLAMNENADLYDFDPLGLVASGGTGHIFGTGYYTNNIPLSSGSIVIIADSSGDIITLEQRSNGDLRLTRIGGVNVDMTTPFTAGQWHYLELFWEHSDTGDWEIFVDGVSIGSESAVDLSNGGTLNLCSLSGAGGVSTQYFDDVYWLSGATAATDRLGGSSEASGPEVFPYQNTAEDATDQGDTLDNGTWALVGELPVNEGASNDASYDVGSAQKDGHTITDEGSRAGPSGDANIDGDSNIKGGKWVFRLARTSGSGVDHVMITGHNGNITERAVTLGSMATFIHLSEGADVPTSSESFALGFGSSSTGDGVGGRDPIAGELFGMLLHVPSAAGATRTPPVGSAVLTGIGGIMDLGLIVPTEV